MGIPFVVESVPVHHVCFAVGHGYFNQPFSRAHFGLLWIRMWFSRLTATQVHSSKYFFPRRSRWWTSTDLGALSSSVGGVWDDVANTVNPSVLLPLIQLSQCSPIRCLHPFSFNHT